MHPIERLRIVARASGEGPGLLGAEAAGALAAFGADPAGLVTACRRMVDRQPTSGPFWWLCARVLAAGDPVDEAWRSAEEMRRGPHAADADPWPCPRPRPSAVLGWPERLGAALTRRGDVEVLVVDVLGEGSGSCGALQRPWTSKRSTCRSRGSAPRRSRPALVAARGGRARPGGFVAVAGSTGRGGGAATPGAGVGGGGGRTGAAGPDVVGAAVPTRPPASRGTSTTRSSRSTWSIGWSARRAPSRSPTRCRARTAPSPPSS